MSIWRRLTGKESADTPKPQRLDYLNEGLALERQGEYEAALTEKKTGWSAGEIQQRVGTRVVTRGADGVSVYEADGSVIDVPAIAGVTPVDPTGVGDAFRAGLICGIDKGCDWLTIGRMGNLMGALKVEHPGTQNQRFDFAEFNDHFRQQFGYSLD